MAPRPPRPTAPAPSYTKPFNDPYAEDRSNQSSSKTTADKPEVRGNTRQEKDAQRRRDRQEVSKNIAGTSTRTKTGVSQSATRGLSSKQKTGGAALDSRFGISGLDKGGIASKKKKKKKSK